MFQKYVFMRLTTLKLRSASHVEQGRVRNILSSVAKSGNNMGSSLLLRNCACKSFGDFTLLLCNKQICARSVLSIDKSTSLS